MIRHRRLLKTAHILAQPFLLFLICQATPGMLFPNKSDAMSLPQVLLWLLLSLVLYAPLAYLLTFATAFLEALLSYELDKDGARAQDAVNPEQSGAGAPKRPQHLSNA